MAVLVGRSLSNVAVGCVCDSDASKFCTATIHQDVNTVPTVGDGLVALVDVDRGALLDLRLPHEDEDVDDQLGHSARNQALSLFEGVGSKSELASELVNSVFPPPPTHRSLSGTKWGWGVLALQIVTMPMPAEDGEHQVDLGDDLLLHGLHQRYWRFCAITVKHMDSEEGLLVMACYVLLQKFLNSIAMSNMWELSSRTRVGGHPD